MTPEPAGAGVSAGASTSEGEEPGRELTHVDGHGHARMVDVTEKAVTTRHAEARCVVRASDEAVARLSGMEDVGAFAKAAGIQAAKRSPSFIPLCHPLPLDEVTITVQVGTGAVAVEAHTSVHARTGVEIEALVACAMTGLTLLMAVLPGDPEATLGTLALWEKSGGRSGTWVRKEPPQR